MTRSCCIIEAAVGKATSIPIKLKWRRKIATNWRLSKHIATSFVSS